MGIASNMSDIETSPSASSADGVVVTPSDATVISMTRAVYVGGAGNLAVLFWNGASSVTLTAVPAGSILPIRVKKVYSSGTTATSIVALY